MLISQDFVSKNRKIPESFLEAFDTAYTSDDEPWSKKADQLHNLWVMCDKAQKTALDSAFIALCGYSVGTLCKK